MVGGLRGKLFGAVAVVAVVPLVVLLLVGFHSLERVFSQVTERNLQALAQLQVSQFQSYLREKEQLSRALVAGEKGWLQALHRLQIATLPPKRRAKLLQVVRRRWASKAKQNKLTGVAVRDEKGRLLWAMGTLRKERQNKHHHHRHKPYAAATPSGGDIRILGIFHFSHVRDTVLRMATPLSSVDGRFYTLLTDFPFALHRRFLMAKQAPAFQAMIYLLDESQKVVCGSFSVSHEHHHFGVKKTIPFWRPGGSSKALGRVHRYTKASGEKAFGIAMPMQDVPWTLWVELPYAQAFQVLRHLSTQGLVWALFFVGGLLFAAGWLARTITRPIRRLLLATREFSQGNFRVPLPEPGKDEVGELTRAFHDMGRELRHLYDDLESKVSERTDELKQWMTQAIQSEKMAALGLLSSGVAHEIGNPLASIFAGLQRLSRRAESPEEKEHLHALEERCETISRILDTLRHYTRKRGERVVPVDLNREVQRALDLVRFDRRLRAIEIITELSPNLPLLWAREDAMMQVVTNLLLNAVDAVAEQEEPTIEVKTWPTTDGVRLSVQDNGPGVAPSQAQVIFEPFVTTKPESQGTGLGLAICKGIVASLGGDIAVTSTEPHGARFTIALPTSQPTESRS